MTRIEKELMLINAFGLKVGDKIKYRDWYWRDMREAKIIQLNMVEDCLMLSINDGKDKRFIEDILTIDSTEHHYFLYKDEKDLTRKERHLIALDLLDIHAGDQVIEDGLFGEIDGGYICTEDLNDIILRGKIFSYPVENLYLNNDWKKS